MDQARKGARPLFLARDRVVGVEEVFGVVALLDLAEPVEDLWREDLGYIEGLLNEVEVAAGVVGLE